MLKELPAFLSFQTSRDRRHHAAAEEKEAIRPAQFPREAAITPLVVDLDRALVRSNLLLESVFAHLGQNALRFGETMRALRGGKAALKSHIAATTSLDAAALPYDEEVLNLVRASVAGGVPVYLVSTNDEQHVRAVVGHLGLFTGWFASTGSEGLSDATKVQRLVDAFGTGGFDYIGSGADDYPIWAVARKRIATRETAAVRASLVQLDREATFLSTRTNRARAWAKLLRVHQWAKNALVFVPLATAHRFDLPAFGAAIAAFVAFSLAASAIYILNDLVDIDADRKHPTKKNRPLAAGTVPAAAALYAAGFLVLAALALASLVTTEFVAVLVFYLVLTT